MYAICGLGNPGKKYRYTRHNTGFLVIEKILEDYPFKKLKAKNSFAFYVEKLNSILFMPLTFMNLSSIAVKEILKKHQIPPSKLIVIYDDVDLPSGTIRIRKKGSAGGHKGIKSIIELLGTEEFIRVRIGIDKPPEFSDLSSYVLSKFTSYELKVMQDTFAIAKKVVECIIKEGVDIAMNKFNRRKKQ